MAFINHIGQTDLIIQAIIQSVIHSLVHSLTREHSYWSIIFVHHSRRLRRNTTYRRLVKWPTHSNRPTSTCPCTWCLAQWWKRSFGESWTAWMRTSAFRCGICSRLPFSHSLASGLDEFYIDFKSS